MVLWENQAGRVKATVAQAGDERAERVVCGGGYGGGGGDRQGRGAGDKGESQARRGKEFQASESILLRFPPKSHSCQGSDRCCD